MVRVDARVRQWLETMTVTPARLALIVDPDAETRDRYGVILTAAREAGANGKAILSQMRSPAVTAALTRAAKQAAADQVPGTPTFVIERPPALSQPLRVTGLDPASFVAALTTALQQ